MSLKLINLTKMPPMKLVRKKKRKKESIRVLQEENNQPRKTTKISGDNQG